MRKRTKSGVSSNRNVRIAKKVNGPSFEGWLVKVESVCRVFVIACRLHWLCSYMKPLIEQYLLSS